MNLCDMKELVFYWGEDSSYLHADTKSPLWQIQQCFAEPKFGGLPIK